MKWTHGKVTSIKKTYLQKKMAFLTEQEQTNLVILSVVTSLISFLAAMTVVITIFMGSKGFCGGALRGVKVERLSFHLIAMVSISDAIRTLGNLFGAPASDSGLCGFQTFLKIFGGTASFAWVAVITFVMYTLLMDSKKWDKFSLQKYKKIFHGICWLFAFVNALIPVAGGYYANTSSWCFIDHSDAGILLRFFCYYLWVVLVWFIIVILYIRIWRFIKKHKVELSSIPTVSKLLYYPLIFFFCWFWSLLRRSFNVFSSDGEAPIGIIGLQIFFGNLYGLANAIMYGWIVRYHLKNTSQSISDQSSIQDNTQLTQNNDQIENIDDEQNKTDPEDDNL
eukprot:155753_1